MLAYTSTSVPTSSQALGQINPQWDNETSSVSFSDCFGTQLFRYSNRRNEMDTFTVPGVVNPSFIIPIENSKQRYLVGSNGTVFVVKWNGRSSSGSIERILFTVARNATIGSAYCLYFKVWRAVHRRPWARVLFRFPGSTVLQIYGRWWFGGNHQTLGSNRQLGHYREYFVHLGRMHKHSVVVQSRSKYWRVV